MNLKIYTLEKTLFDDSVKEIIANTTSGQISVLQHHIPIITRLKKGPLTCVMESGEKKTVDIPASYLEVQPHDAVVVLCDPE